MEKNNKTAVLFAEKISKTMADAIHYIGRNDEYSNTEKFKLIKLLSQLIAEILNDDVICERMKKVAKESIQNGDNIEDKFDTFKMIRNIIIHFPIFESWNDIYVSEDLLEWNKPGYSQIKKYFETEKQFSYRIYLLENNEWAEKVNININVPQLKPNKEIFLKIFCRLTMRYGLLAQ